MFQKGTDPQVTQGVNGPFWGIPGHKQEFPGMWFYPHFCYHWKWGQWSLPLKEKRKIWFYLTIKFIVQKSKDFESSLNRRLQFKLWNKLTSGRLDMIMSVVVYRYFKWYVPEIPNRKRNLIGQQNWQSILLPITFEKKVNTLYIYIPFESPLAFVKIRQRTNEVAAMKASALAPKAALHRERYLETRSNWK